jgi:hypothetical protein
LADDEEDTQGIHLDDGAILRPPMEVLGEESLISRSQETPIRKSREELIDMTSVTSAHHADLQFEEQELDESSVSVLGGAAPGGITAQALAGNGFTYRHDWGPRNGFWTLNLTSQAFSVASRVFVSIGEGPTVNGGKLIGNSRFLVYNVAPENGVVSIRVHIDWPSPIGLVADYFVVNP